MERSPPRFLTAAPPTDFLSSSSGCGGEGRHQTKLPLVLRTHGHGLAAQLCSTSAAANKSARALARRPRPPSGINPTCKLYWDRRRCRQQGTRPSLRRRPRRRGHTQGIFQILATRRRWRRRQIRDGGGRIDRLRDVLRRWRSCAARLNDGCGSGVGSRGWTRRQHHALHVARKTFHESTGPTFANKRPNDSSNFGLGSSGAPWRQVV